MKQYSPKKIIDFLLKKGRIIHHIKGSHHVMLNPITGKRTIVAKHVKDIPIGTLQAILKQTGYTKEDLDNNRK